MTPIAERQKLALLQNCEGSKALILSDHNSRSAKVVRTKPFFLSDTEHGPNGVKKQGMSTLSTAQDQGELE